MGGAQRRQHQCRSRVAGDDDEVGRVARDEVVHRRADPFDQRLFGEGAIGEKGVVGDVDEFEVGARLGDAREHRQPAEAGIEHQSRRRTVVETFMGGT